MKFPQLKSLYATIINSSYSLSRKSKYIAFTPSTISHTTFKNSNASSLIVSYFSTLKKSTSDKGLFYSNPTFNHSSNKVTINLFYFLSSHSRSARENMKNTPTPMSYSILDKSNDLSSLSESLAYLYGKEVSLVFTRIHYPYLNSAIFSQYLVHNAASNTFIHFKNSILTYPSRNASKLPAYVSGIKIEVAGRLLTERVVPRITTKRSLFGSFSGASMVDYGKCTTKNALGAFTVKV